MTSINISQFWRNPVFYGSLGFILVAVPCIYFFLVGVSGTMVSVTETADGNRTVVVEEVRQGAYNPFLLIFVIGAGISALGCYRNTKLAWAGSIFVLVYSILAMFSIGMLILPGALFLIIGSALKTFNKN